jgi:hypothetical protein
VLRRTDKTKKLVFSLHLPTQGTTLPDENGTQPMAESDRHPPFSQLE